MEICQPFFHIGRGYRQGDPVSPFLFVLCTEILGITIRNKKGIKGIVINNKEHKLSQYADDTVFILDGTSKNNNKRKVQGVPQSQTVALPRHQEEEETDKSKQAHIEQTYEKH